jgi:hypothetical protein
MPDYVQLWQSILTADSPAWVAFSGGHCVLLPDPSHNPAQQAGSLLAQALSDGEIAEHDLGYLYITGPVFTLVLHEEASDRAQVAEIALRKRSLRKVLHVELPVPVRQLAALILREAKKDSIPEVALEPLEGGGTVRFLQDGDWNTVMQLRPGVLPKLIDHLRPQGLQIQPGPWGDCARLHL